MAPSVDSIPAPVEQVDIKSKNETQTSRQPLQLKGALDQFKSFDVTPIIGREFVDVNLAEWLHAENSDDLIRDLAITSKCSLCFLDAVCIPSSSYTFFRNFEHAYQVSREIKQHT